MRHTNAGLAIPDFPLMFGHLVPDHWDPKIAIHFTHRVGAVIVTLAIIATAGHAWYHHRQRRELTRPAVLLLVLVGLQVTLGGLTVLSQRDVWINSLHVVCGALVLTTSLVLTLRTWRVKFATQTTVRLKPDTTGRSKDLRHNVVEQDFSPALSSVRLQADRDIEAKRA